MKTEGVETWRIFCAIELPESVRKLALQHLAHLKEKVPNAKASWARDASLHLTLKFIGEIPKTSVANFSAAVSRVVSDVPVFSIRLEQTGTFPTHGEPRVLWVGINDESSQLAKLHARLEEESAGAGFAKDTRPYHPHLTIARLRQPYNARALAAAHKQLEFAPLEIAVTELLVIRSELSSEGSKYTAVSRHPLFGVRI
jgi:RNA 2',3'-cyclic 3'-phosphodiesterase